MECFDIFFDFFHPTGEPDSIICCVIRGSR